MAPRIPPVTDLDEDVAGYLDRLVPKGRDGQTLNVFATLAHHPPLLKGFVRLTGELILNGTLPARDRELLILRTGWNCQSIYEWGQHVAIGRQVGLSDEEIGRVASGPDDPAWGEADRLLLRAADELHAAACVTDETWEQLAARYDLRQLVELLMLVGQYTSLSFVLNSAGVEREPGVAGWELATTARESTPPGRGGR